MKVSVLICTYKRKKLLDRCLQSLIADSIDKPDEIVIVDGEEGSAKDIVSKWQKQFADIKFISTKNVNLAVSRNIGLPHCMTEIVALTDDDVQVAPDWVRRIRALHKEHPEAGGIGGKISGVTDRFIDRVANIVIFFSRGNSAYVRTVPGVNASYKREIIEKVGSYDESLFRGEDVDYNWRILKLGSKIYYDPRLCVCHYHRSTWKGLFSQLFMYGRAYYLVRSKWKDMYCVYPHTIRHFKDILKLGYFFFGCLFEAVFCTRGISGFSKKAMLFPFLIICQFVWKLGMITEVVKQKFFQGKLLRK
ncbi:MAG: glycosyltransferase [Omnitrophica bacterium]|nr:glycosyltransferase [Candidatus Omnitrophota bacterium]